MPRKRQNVGLEHGGEAGITCIANTFFIQAARTIVAVGDEVKQVDACDHSRDHCAGDGAAFTEALLLGDHKCVIVGIKYSS